MFSLKKLWSSEERVSTLERAVLSPGTSIPRALTPFPRSDIKDGPATDLPAAIETREAERFVPSRTSTLLVTDNGKKLRARIINVSALGIAIEADFSQVPAQSVVMVGERKVKPGRKIARGTVFLFEKPLAPSLCGPHFVP